MKTEEKNPNMNLAVPGSYLEHILTILISLTSYKFFQLFPFFARWNGNFMDQNPTNQTKKIIVSVANLQIIYMVNFHII